MLDVGSYLNEVTRIYKTGAATEHSYRPVLERLFNSIAADVTALNEPRAVKVGRPDFVFQRGQITVGHCEAKDIGLDIDPRAMKDANKEQFERYRKALPNLVYTNGIDFRFYKHGELTRGISIADLPMGVKPKPDQFAALANQLRDFAAERLQTITSAERLAEMMAGKAVLIKDILFNSLKEDKDLGTELNGQFQAFRDQLIHDLSPEDFADLYAETVAYGLFGARLHDSTLQTFTREEALQLLPKSNPFLRNLFGYVAGPQLDERIRRTIDELAEIFQATDLLKLFADFGKFTQRNDPFIHFYETFLAQYNPAKRKSRGVWYTPEPVVNFIVRAVDDVLKTEFGLADGLADTSKIAVDWDTGQKDKKGKPVIIRKEVHRVQILDPAAGTGTFLAEVIKQIAPRIKTVAPGQWSSYVERELIPRLHGFELLMASYAMCHMKLDMMLTELGYKPTTSNPPRLSVYLTNSLEEGEEVNQTLPFAQWLSNEAKEASTVKRDMPIMCVIGNPPYNIQSGNLSPEQVALIEPYRSVDGVRIKEKGMLLICTES
jgi:type I restriction-modification system DNA methylase subunit